MQPPCFLLKRYLEVNPAFYRTSPLSFLVTPPVTFAHWLLALAASFDASCRLTLSTPPVDSILRRLLSSRSLCSAPPLGASPTPVRHRLLVSSPVSLPHRLLVLLLPSVPRRLLAPWSLETASLSHQPSPNPASPTASQPCLCSAPQLSTPLSRLTQSSISLGALAVHPTVSQPCLSRLRPCSAPQLRTPFV